jgi:hypothetical protein
MNKLGIVVPYRNRYEHLQRFKQSIIEYLDKNGYEKYSIIIIEQDDAKLFNRGMLCNIGFLESQKQKCDYIVIHDVDMIPIDVDYSYSSHPIHLATDNLPFESYFGGITLFPSETFKKINGFSNVYWGWGFEDDDLRYRCVKNNIEFEKHIKESITQEKVPIFNGVDAYSEIPNIINYNRDFKIHLDINLDRVVYDVDSVIDIFPILTIQGYDLKLYYNSFNRFYLQLFDKNGKYYDVYSNIVTSSHNKISIEYNRTEKEIVFKLNDELKKINLENYIKNYSNTDFIIFGSDVEKEYFFKGTLNEFLIEQNNEIKLKYKNYNIILEEYYLRDISGNKNNGTFFNVYMDYFSPLTNYYSYIPYRRKTKLEKLSHEDCGFKDGRWKDDNSRWNQLRYNNEVQFGYRDDIEDGLTSLEYTTYSKIKEKNYIHLKVGI